MKAIKLTEEHKSKLLEMCNKLFPEYGDVQLLKSYCATEYDATGSPYLRWYIPFEHNGKKTTKLIEIHWFEFCLMHIVPKLLKSHLDKEEFYLYVNDSNPINYLYKYFKN